MRIKKVQSPECPLCECNATDLVAAGMNAGRPWARYQCEFCQHKFTVGKSPLEPGIVNGVQYRTVHCKCPKCGAKNPKPHTVRGRIRYHKCENCSQNFKSVQVD